MDCIPMILQDAKSKKSNYAEHLVIILNVNRYKPTDYSMGRKLRIEVSMKIQLICENVTRKYVIPICKCMGIITRLLY
jgi:hypothetical protein